MVGKVKLLRNIPVGPEYGLIKNRVVQILRDARNGLWVAGDVPGDDVKLLSGEYEYFDGES